jgi:hypothetical protein
VFAVSIDAAPLWMHHERGGDCMSRKMMKKKLGA